MPTLVDLATRIAQDVKAVRQRVTTLERDTGWRNITPPNLLSSGALLIRRRGTEVTVKLDAGVFLTTGAGFLGTLPGEFRPTYRERESWYLDQNRASGGTLNFSPFGTVNIYDINSTTAPIFFSARYLTAAAWPTTLPGTPA